MSGDYLVAVLSDIHYASAPEQARGHYFYLGCVKNPLRRLALRLYRKYIWQRDPFAHNHLVDRFIQTAQAAHHVVATGDYSCDSACVGVCDAAACQSARECLQALRQGFPGRFHAIFGDHELGKKPLGSDVGGLRVASYHRGISELGLQPFWQFPLGNYVLMGITSTLVELPVFEPEALPEEWAEWRHLRAEHLAQIRAAFAALQPEQRVLLFCHDPTALPFLWREPAIQSKLAQVERTIIGHLHSPLVLFKSRWLAGMPVISFLGHTPRRLSRALRDARYWKPFRVTLCPALPGIELLKDGGFVTLELDPAARRPARVQRHTWKRMVQGSPFKVLKS
jgi:hypothetical protein